MPTLGFVLDGLPADAAQLNALGALGLSPQRLLVVSDPAGGEGIQKRLAALLGAGAGAAAVTCAPDDVDCVEEVENEAEDVADDI